VLPWITRRCLAPRLYVFHRVFPTFGPGRGLLSNPFLPSPPSRFGTAMAGANALVGGRVGTGEVCLVGVQSDFPAPAVHRERQRPDRPGPRPSAPLKLYIMRAGKRRIFRDAQRQSLAVRSSERTLQEDAGPTSSTSAEKTGAHGPRGGPLLLSNPVHIRQRGLATAYARVCIHTPSFYSSTLACEYVTSIRSGVRARQRCVWVVKK
jgi:hypothetical protein